MHRQYRAGGASVGVFMMLTQLVQLKLQGLTALAETFNDMLASHETIGSSCSNITKLDDEWLNFSLSRAKTDTCKDQLKHVWCKAQTGSLYGELNMSHHVPTNAECLESSNWAEAAKIGMNHMESSKLLSSGGDIKIAFMFVVADAANYMQITRMFKLLYSTKHWYLFHVDFGKDLLHSLLSAFLLPYSNAWIAGFRFHNIWSGDSLFRTYEAGLKELMSKEWDVFINFSGSDYLTYPLSGIERVLSQLRGKNFLKIHSHLPTAESGFKAHQQNIVVKQAGDGIFHQCDNYMYRIGTRSFPADFNYVGGSDWYILSRSFVNGTIGAATTGFLHGIRMLARTTAAAAEHYFHLLAANSKFCRDTIWQTNFRLDAALGVCVKRDSVDWTSGCSPRPFRMQHRIELQSTLSRSLLFFVRKVSGKTDYRIINWFDGIRSKYETKMQQNSNTYSASDKSPVKLLTSYLEPIFSMGHKTPMKPQDEIAQDRLITELARLVNNSIAAHCSTSNEVLKLKQVYILHSQPTTFIQAWISGYIVVIGNQHQDIRLFVGIPMTRQRIETSTTAAIDGQLLIGSNIDMLDRMSRSALIHKSVDHVTVTVYLKIDPEVYRSKDICRMYGGVQFVVGRCCILERDQSRSQSCGSRSNTKSVMVPNGVDMVAARCCTHKTRDEDFKKRRLCGVDGAKAPCYLLNSTFGKALVGLAHCRLQADGKDAHLYRNKKLFLPRQFIALQFDPKHFFPAVWEARCMIKFEGRKIAEMYRKFIVFPDKSEDTTKQGQDNFSIKFDSVHKVARACSPSEGVCTDRCIGALNL